MAVTKILQPVLISSPTGVGAETVGKLLSSKDHPWFRGDKWGARPSNSEDEWTYKDSDFVLPSSNVIPTMTDGSDICPWILFKRKHPNFKVIRLICNETDLLNRRNAWRRMHDLPRLVRVGELTTRQLALATDVDYIFVWPDRCLHAVTAFEVIHRIQMIIQGERLWL